MRINSAGEVLIGTTTQGRETDLAVVGPDQSLLGAWSQFGIYSNDSYAINKGGSMMFGGQDGLNVRSWFAGIKGAKENSTNQNYAGYLAFYTRPSGSTPVERMRLNSLGNVLIGTNTALRSNREKLEIKHTAGEALLTHTNDLSYAHWVTKSLQSAGGLHYIAWFGNSGGVNVGKITHNNTATSYTTSSDYRLKENVVPMSGATAQTKLLKPCNFDWISDGSNVNGFLAHELAEVVPEAVTGTKDAMMDEEYEVTPATDTEAAVMGTRSVPDLQGVDQSKLVPLLTATIQELIARIEVLENA
jgi:hypothetical protein